MFTDYIRILRPPNLIIVVLTQSLVFALMLLPAYRTADVLSALSTGQMALLILCTLCITAGGNLINDLYDHEIDSRNKPERTWVGRSIPLSAARWYYGIVLVLGLVIALYLAIATNNLPWLILYPAACGWLWAYSRYLKCMPLVGNLSVGALCALVVGIVWFAERNAFATLADKAPLLAAYLQRDLLFYMGFAFTATWFREMVKDIEDLPGDKASGCRTLVVRIGPTAGRSLSLAVLLALGGLLFIYFGQSGSPQTMLLFAPVWFCVLLAFYFLLRARETAHFRRISQLAKLIILLGLILFPFLNRTI